MRVSGPPSRPGRPRNLSEEVERIKAERSRYDKQFDHIDPALTAFVFRHEALRLPQPCGQFLLRDIRPSPGSGQTRADDLVMLGLNPQCGYPRSCALAKVVIGKSDIGISDNIV